MLRHISISLALLLFFSYTLTAQTNVSDTKLMHLKGRVKSIVRYVTPISGYAEEVLNNKTRDVTTELFDREGNITETKYAGKYYSSRLVYAKIDGFKTFKTVDQKPDRGTGDRFTIVGAKQKEEPIEPDEKITPPDNRFDYRYVYETDKQGRIISERMYGNTGKLYKKRTFEYDKSGVLVKEREEDTGAVMTYVFKYDGAGTLIEVNKTRDIKGAGSDSKDRTVYSDYKFDSAGNWIERRSTNYSKTDPMPQYNIPAKSYTLVDVESRTFTYY